MHRRPVFQPSHHNAFAAELRAAAQTWLDEHHDHRHANTAAILKISVIAAVAALFYTAALHAVSGYVYVGLYVCFAVAAMLLAANTLHDASHGALFRSRAMNGVVMRFSAIPLGIEPVYWQVRHVRYHHPNANIEHIDLDTAANRFLRQTPFQPWFPQFRFQHLYWPLIAGLSLPYIGLIYDWSDRFGMTPLAQDRALRGVGGWLRFVASKLAHLLLCLGLPLWLVAPTIGYTAVIVAYVSGQLLASSLLVTLILGTHWADAHFYDVSDGKPLPHTREEHAFLTCCDWTAPPLMGGLLGGLNLHLTHHLFPHVHHRHYPALAKLVAQTAARHGLSYRCLSYRELLRAQQHFLKSMGQRPEVMYA
ncbi:MAG: fatty acid desaturase [Methylobacillus sp.]|jgi:linoleoyl-CoA desaturase|nr:fatty acid desaturase [Methylobacillus sp.]